MMADNIEHVISYWVIFQTISFAGARRLCGRFALGSVSAVWADSAAHLADRFDIRRLIQIGMLLFMARLGQLGRDVLDRLDDAVEGDAAAGRAWTGRGHLDAGLAGADPSDRQPRNSCRAQCASTPPDAIWAFWSVRRSGRRLLLAFGPAWGIFVNALIYAPLFVWLINAPYGSGAPRLAGSAVARSAASPISGRRCEWWRTATMLLSMTVLVGAASFFVGNAYQAQMPGFARDLGHGRADFSYSMLLAADAAGGLRRRRAAGDPRFAAAAGAHRIHPGHDLVLRACLGFARAKAYGLALVLLFVGGIRRSSHSIRWRRPWCRSTHRARCADA